MKMLEARFRIFNIVVRIAAILVCLFAVLFLVLPYQESEKTPDSEQAELEPPEINNLSDQSTWEWQCCEPPCPKEYAYCPHCGTHQRHVRFEQHLLRLESDPVYAKRWKAVEERLESEGK